MLSWDMSMTKQPSSVVWSMLVCIYRLCCGLQIPLSVFPNCQLDPQTSFALLGRPCSLISRTAIPWSLYSQQLVCGRNVVDIADGFDIPENQQYLCLFYPTLLAIISSFSGQFLVNLYIPNIFLKYQNRNSILYKYPCGLWRHHIRALLQKTRKLR